MIEVCGYCKDTHGRHRLGCPYLEQQEEIAKWRSKHGYKPELPLRTDGIHTVEECGKVPVGHQYQGVVGPTEIAKELFETPGEWGKGGGAKNSVGHQYQGVVGPAPLTPFGEAQKRKQLPVATGVVDYFPDALKEVSGCSYSGNAQHNPGQPLHWSRGKSDDHPDCLMRHFIERGTFDTDGIRHSAKVAWRALAILQLEIENAKKL